MPETTCPQCGGPGCSGCDWRGSVEAPDVPPVPLREQIAHAIAACWESEAFDNTTDAEALAMLAAAVLPLVEAAVAAEREAGLARERERMDGLAAGMHGYGEQCAVAERERLHTQLRRQAQPEIERLMEDAPRLFAADPLSVVVCAYQEGVRNAAERLLGVAATPQPEEPEDGR